MRGWSRTGAARAETFCPEPSKFLIGAGIIPWVGDRRRSSAKIFRSKYLELRSEPPELGHFQGVGAGADTVGTLNSEPEPEPEPECFPGAGAEPFKTIPALHPCFWPFSAILAA